MLPFLIHHAHAYELLAPLPLGPNGPAGGTINDVLISDYMPAMVKLIIAIAGGLAVIRIIIGGIEYMSTDAFSGKSSAKETIQNALIGLLLTISAYTILNTINPALVKLNLNIPKYDLKTQATVNLGSDLAVCSESKPCTTGSASTCSSAASCTSQLIKACSPASPCTSGLQLCPNCIVVFDNSPIPHKPLDQACLPPYPCQLEDVLNERLRALANKAAPLNIDWWVTEMYPPTVTHDSDCHKNTPKAGKCADATIKNLTDPDIGLKIVEMSALISDNVSNASNNFQWEVSTYDEEQAWIAKINAWFTAHPNNALEVGPVDWKHYTFTKFVVNPCPSCSLHVHINSPTLAP